MYSKLRCSQYDNSIYKRAYQTKSNETQNKRQLSYFNVWKYERGEYEQNRLLLLPHEEISMLQYYVTKNPCCVG